MTKHWHPAAKAALKVVLAGVLAGGCGLAAAGDFKGDLLFPWEAHGKLYATGPKTLMLLGEIEGTLYAAEAGKSKFDGARIVCPMLHEFSLEDKTVHGEGRCTIFPKDSEDVIFATYSCSGRLGACEGTLELTAGTGSHFGITGSAAMASRTGVTELALQLGPGGSISSAEGLMKITGFTCESR